MLALFRQPFSGRAARLLASAALGHPLLTADFSHLHITLSISLLILFFGVVGT